LPLEEDMNFGESVKSALSNYATFSNRAPRSEFWYFVLFYAILNIIALIVDISILGHAAGGTGAAGLIVAVALFLPYIAVSVRRLHDIDKSGWFLLVVIVPVVGAIFLIIWACTKGSEGDNRFGVPYPESTPEPP
jgi:uncharacterized membrane protein YhaH (DUF805 family)